MTSATQFIAEGETVPLSRIWVHLKRRPRGRTARFSWHIPAVSVPHVFGTQAVDDLEKGSSFFRFWKKDFDTLTVNFWLSRAMGDEPISKEPPTWVISAITRVKQIDNDFLIEGVVEEFAPDLY